MNTAHKNTFVLSIALMVCCGIGGMTLAPLYAVDQAKTADSAALPAPGGADDPNQSQRDDLGDMYRDDDSIKPPANRSMVIFDKSDLSPKSRTPTDLSPGEVDAVIGGLMKSGGNLGKAVKAGAAVGSALDNLIDPKKAARGVLNKVDDKQLIQLTQKTVYLVLGEFFDPDQGLVPAVKKAVAATALDLEALEKAKNKKPSLWDKAKSTVKNTVKNVGNTILKQTMSAAVEVVQETGKGWLRLAGDAAIAFAVLSIKAAILAAIVV